MLPRPKSDIVSLRPCQWKSKRHNRYSNARATDSSSIFRAFLNEKSSFLWSLILLAMLFGCNSSDASKSKLDSNSEKSKTILSDSRQGTDTKKPAPQSVQGRALAYLFANQSKDGGWHSPNYGALKDGAAITCLVLYAVSHCDEKELSDYQDKIKNGVQFLLPQIKKYGYVRNKESPDYTNYSAAMLLVADKKLGLGLSDEIRNQLAEFLMNSQLDETHGYSKDHVDYGGWDLMGWSQVNRVSAGSNISVSAATLEALVDAKDSDLKKQTFAKLKTWLPRCQNLAGDGGFHFHPEKDHDGNKAGWNDESRSITNSYGTATCDGIRLLSMGESLFEDKKAFQERTSKAVQWLEKNHEVASVPGFTKEPSTGWELGLRYYYYFVLSKAASELSEMTRAKLGNEIRTILKKEQAADGSFSNPNNRMREDDPLIATSFCVIALANFAN